VYLSYRRGDKIFWTRKQASLHKGEKLLTDGRTTSRTRCGNQVSVLPQAKTAPNEPTMAELDRPDEMASGMNRALPSTFDSDLMVLDPGLTLGPTGSSPVCRWASAWWFYADADRRWNHLGEATGKTAAVQTRRHQPGM
jgi:hypothetical protein